MIRYDITEVALRAKIDHQQADWQTRAATATSLFQQAGKYGEPDDKTWDTQTYGVPPAPFWGQIKPVYMRLQKRKCAFCERKLTVRTKDHDVEHFRPKRAVEAWPSYPADSAFPEGYYSLAYHPLNYATACEHCNRGLKRSWFPVAATRLSGQTDPQQMAFELPLLIYPIGHIDADPEELIGFRGITAIVRNGSLSSHEQERASVSIEFFELNVREELLRERADVIVQLFLALAHEVTSSMRLLARRVIRTKTADMSQHTNCARCFVALYRQDPRAAKRLFELASRYLETV